MEYYEVIGVVNGSHYSLTYDTNIGGIGTRSEAIKIMIGLQNKFNKSPNIFVIGTIQGEPDIIRVNTIEKMYFKETQ